jgi:hypothetical protein
VTQGVSPITGSVGHRSPRRSAKCLLSRAPDPAHFRRAALAGAAITLFSGSSVAGALTPAKTVRQRAIASQKTLNAAQVKACKVAKIAVPTRTTSTTAPAGRQVKGTLVTLGAGTFAGGTDVAAGLYDVTPAAGESGNFSTTGPNEYNEILGGDSSTGGVPSVSVTLSKGDVIAISGLSQVVMTAH